MVAETFTPVTTLITITYPVRWLNHSPRAIFHLDFRYLSTVVVIIPMTYLALNMTD